MDDIIDMQQKIEIPLEVFLEMKEWYDKREEVKIIEKVDDGGELVESSITWFSNGEELEFLSKKLSQSEERNTKLSEINRILQVTINMFNDMSIAQFISVRKALRKKTHRVSEYTK